MRFIRFSIKLAGAAALGLLAACAPIRPTGPTVATPAAPPACTPAALGDALVGNWLSVAAQQGVAGSVRTLFTLNPDGTMHYVEQVKRPRTPSQGLEESGCWLHQGDSVVLRTLQSNGMPVSLDDPIYTNTYRVIRIEANNLLLQGPQGQVKAKRMAPGYRLPF